MAKKKTKKQTRQDPLQKELEAIKRLLMALLLKTGGSRDDLALALGMDPSDVSRIMPVQKIKAGKKSKGKKTSKGSKVNDE